MPIDAHAHLSSPELRGQLPELLERALQAHIQAIVNVTTDPEEMRHGLELQTAYPWIHLAAATPPQDVREETQGHFAEFAAAARSGKLIALGETGLDYRVPGANPALQQESLRAYFALAKECNLPLIFHCREAFADLFALLDAGYSGPFMVHCFTGTQAEAEAIVARKGFVSLSGILTFKRAEELRQIVASLPLEHILIETDAPYLAPQSHRGEPNEPAYLLETLAVLAAVRGMRPEEVATATAANACRLFRID